MERFKKASKEIWFQKQLFSGINHTAIHTAIVEKNGIKITFSYEGLSDEIFRAYYVGKIRSTGLWEP